MPYQPQQASYGADSGGGSDGGFNPLGMPMMGLGAFTSFMGANQRANAAQNIAGEQYQAALENRGTNMTFASRMNNAALPTDQELQQMQAMLQNQGRTQQLQEAAWQRDINIANATNPAIISGGQQLFGLLNGQSSPMIAPMQAQIAQQQAELRNRLAQQLGPGWESTTQGQQALQQFQTQANMSIAQAQQGSIGQLLNPVYGSNPNLGNTANSFGGTMGQLYGQNAGALNTLQGRVMNANNMGASISSGSNMTPYAGADNAKGLMMGNYWNGMGNAMFGYGMANASPSLNLSQMGKMGAAAQ